jgi:anti-repressor protein
LVDARELWKALESGKDFSNRVKSKVVRNKFFIENDDWFLLNNSVGQSGRGGHNRRDYLITLDIAKKVAMAEQSE